MITLENRRKPIEVAINEVGCELIINRAISIDGHVSIRINNVYHLAHRIAYEQSYGEIPEDLVVRHKCDNGNCINPKHLILGTHADNVKDRVERNRSSKGSSNGRAKLEEDDVRFIRLDNTYTNTELSKMFSVDARVIRDVKNLKTWKHVK